MDTGKIYLAVSTDLVIDQRIHRTALTLMESGIKPVVTGRFLPGSLPAGDRPYDVKRLVLLFRKGFLFYACFNLRLLFFFLFRRIRLLVANDLDTLPACYLVSRLKKCTLVFDSHEYFTEVPELVGRPFVKGIWKWIERRLLPRIRHAFTVSESIAGEYKKRYGISMAVIRNLPAREDRTGWQPGRPAGDPEKVIIYQGTLNVGRGLELMIRTMQFLENCRFRVFGSGPLRDRLILLCDQLKVSDRVEWMGRLPFHDLRSQTRKAMLGISLEENLGLNYYYALPNKLFDYIHAGVPVLVSDLPEMCSIVREYNIGEVAESREPRELAGQIQKMMSDSGQRIIWGKNLARAAKDLCWENEKGKLKELFQDAGLEFG